MGVFGFVAAGGGSVGVVLGGVLTDAQLALDLLRQRPDRHRRARAVAGACCPTATRPRAAAPRRRRRGDGHRGADARRLRDRRRQRRRLDVGPDARLPGRRGRAAGACSCGSRPRVARRSCRCACSACATSRRPTCVGVLWAAAMFAWFFLVVAVPAAGARLQPTRGRPGVPAGQPRDGGVSVGVSAKLVLRFGVRRPLATGLASPRSGCCCSRARRSTATTRRRVPEHDPARLRRRHRLQPGAAGRDERRRAAGGRCRLGHRQHLVHDGRRPRAQRPRRRRHRAHRRARRRRRRSPRSPAATTSRS